MRNHRLFLIATVLLFVGLAIGQTLFDSFNYNEYLEANVVRVVDNTIILGHNCTAVIADTTDERAYSIQLGIENRIEYRPMIHDSFKEVINAFNITLERVVLEGFDEQYYYSDAYFRTDEKLYKLDMKPSDAIALAVRAKAPIYINKVLLDAKGENICVGFV